MKRIDWKEFSKVEWRVGTVTDVDEFPQARNPAYKITVDFGPELGQKRTSAQVADLYSRDELVGKQVIGVINLAPKQIGPLISEFLLTGFYRDDGYVVLAVPDRQVHNGAKLA